MDPENIVIAKDAEKVEIFAADELAHYLKLITNKKLSVSNRASQRSIYLGIIPDWMPVSRKNYLLSELSSLPPDGFIVKTELDNILILGKTPRATLYGVYSYLQALGVEWFFPGKENEYIPERSDASLTNVDIKTSPDVYDRGIVMYFTETSFLDWVDFACKAKLNSIYIHSDEGLNEMPKLLSNRGLSYNVRRHFFGDRYSSNVEGTYEREKEALLEYINRLPDHIRELFLWPADVNLQTIGDDISITDAVLLFTNEMSKTLRTVRADAKISFLSYWSTWGIPKKIKPSEGVFLEIAPMHRCFSHAIDDPTCPINSKEVLPVIEGLSKVFNLDEAHVLEYWLDASLFGRGKYEYLKGRLPQIGEILKRDIRFYRNKGFEKISTFTVGLNKQYFSSFTSPTVFLYPALLWDNDIDVKSELLRFCEKYYGDRSVYDALLPDEHIDPTHARQSEWEKMISKLSRNIEILSEVLKSARDDRHIDRLGRLKAEYEHVLS